MAELFEVVVVAVSVPLRNRQGGIVTWARVDDADLALVAGRRWYLDSTGYAATDRHTRLHRVLVEVPPGYVVDHINRDRLDNRRANLRVVTQKQNVMNTSGVRTAASRHRGVYFDRRRGTWYAQLKFNGRRFHGGTFSTEAEAAAAAVALRQRVLGVHL